MKRGLRGADGEPPPHAVLAGALYERHGVPYLELSHLSVDDDVLRLVPEEFARHHSLLPVMFKLESESGGKGKKASRRPDVKGRPVALVIAMSDPANVFAVEAIRRRIGIPVQRVVSTWAEIAEAINEHYLKIALADEPASE